MIRNGVAPLSVIAERKPMLEVACSKCQRRKRWQTSKLVSRFGSDAPMPAVLDELATDCPLHRIGDLGSPCSVFMVL